MSSTAYSSAFPAMSAILVVIYFIVYLTFKLISRFAAHITRSSYSKHRLVGCFGILFGVIGLLIYLYVNVFDASLATSLSGQELGRYIAVVFFPVVFPAIFCYGVIWFRGSKERGRQRDVLANEVKRNRRDPRL